LCLFGPFCTLYSSVFAVLVTACDFSHKIPQNTSPRLVRRLREILFFYEGDQEGVRGRGCSDYKRCSIYALNQEPNHHVKPDSTVQLYLLSACLCKIICFHQFVFSCVHAKILKPKTAKKKQRINYAVPEDERIKFLRNAWLS
jgi:hypothetical protein